MNLKELLNKATQTAYPEPDSPIHSAIIPMVVSEFSKHLPAPASVLDIGCGSCFGAKELRKYGYEVTPVSVLQSEADFAISEGFIAHKCEMHETKWLGNFDAAWLRHAAEHSPCPLLLLSNLAEQTRWLFIEVPLPLTSASHESNPNHYSCLTDLGWLNILNQSGWDVVKSQIISFKIQAGDDAYVYFICKRRKE
jgi:SAM-dependent methyltransferase